MSCVISNAFKRRRKTTSAATWYVLDSHYIIRPFCMMLTPCRLPMHDAILTGHARVSRHGQRLGTKSTRSLCGSAFLWHRQSHACMLFFIFSVRRGQGNNNRTLKIGYCILIPVKAVHMLLVSSTLLHLFYSIRSLPILFLYSCLHLRLSKVHHVTRREKTQTPQRLQRLQRLRGRKKHQKTSKPTKEKRSETSA